MSPAKQRQPITIEGYLEGEKSAKHRHEYVFGEVYAMAGSTKLGVRFFCPAFSAVCDSNPDTELFQESPKVIIEVLSKSTRRQDLGDKKDGYLELTFA